MPRQPVQYFPYCTGELALRYLDATRVDYVILRRSEKFTQYYEDWLEHGIPDRRAELVQLPSIAGVDRFTVYRWHWGEYVHTSHPAPVQARVDANNGPPSVTVP